MITVGFVVAVGLPLVVLVLAIVWPPRIPRDRTVEAIRQRIEDEDGSPPVRQAAELGPGRQGRGFTRRSGPAERENFVQAESRKYVAD